MSFALRIHSIKNLITNEDLLSPKKRDGEVEVIEFGQHSFAFQAPLEFPQVHATILFEGAIILNGVEKSFQFTGKISSREIYEKHMRLNCDLMQYDPQLWKSCLHALKNKQDQADSLFHALKGVKK